MRCPNCQCEEHDVLLIDCSLPLEEVRERLRFCYDCRPEAHHPYACCFPRIIMASNLPDEEKQKALAARRYVPDYRAAYSVAERIFDLTAGTPPNVMIS